MEQLLSLSNPNNLIMFENEKANQDFVDDKIDRTAEIAAIAAQAKENDQNQTLREAAWRYKKAMFWSVIVSMVGTVK